MRVRYHVPNRVGTAPHPGRKSAGRISDGVREPDTCGTTYRTYFRTYLVQVTSYMDIQDLPPSGDISPRMRMEPFLVPGSS